MPSTDSFNHLSANDNLNQSTVCLKGVVGQCGVFNALTAAMKRIKELESAAEEKERMYRIGTDAGAFTIKQLTAERDKWKKRTNELLDECDRLNKESCEADSDFVDLVAERDRLQAAVERLATIEDSYETCRIDRDYWKARAEALEMALKAAPPHCGQCVHINVDIKKEPCASCDDMLKNYQFDDTRFWKPEAEAKQ